MIALKALLPFALLAAVVCSCGILPLAGGTSDTGNARVVAVVYTKSGDPAIGASVIVCHKNYSANAEGDSIGRQKSLIRKTITDSLGRFSIDSIENGIYFIEVNDMVAGATLLRADLSLSSIKKIDLKDTLRPYAGIEGNAGGQVSPFGRRFVVAYGIDRRIPIDVSGRFSCRNLPNGVYQFRIISSDTGFAALDLDSITLTSGTVVNSPFWGWRRCLTIGLNTTPSGADVANNVTHFPVLVRLTKNNFLFGTAAALGCDLRFISSAGANLPFEIERWDSAGYRAEIWVKMDTVFGNSASQKFYLYYGNPNATSLQSAGSVFDTNAGFQGVWHLSETKADSVADATKNRFIGIAHNMNEASVKDGMIGHARVFDGASTYISIPNSANSALNLPSDGHYSISAWVYMDSPAIHSQVIVSKGDEQYYLKFDPTLSGFSTWKFIENRDYGGVHVSKAPANLRQWTHITAVKNGDLQFLYVNGQIADSIPDDLSSMKMRYTGFDLAIGKFMESDTGSGECFFQGMIDEVRIENISLSPEWIRLCFMNQKKEDKLLEFKLN